MLWSSLLPRGVGPVDNTYNQSSKLCSSRYHLPSIGAGQLVEDMIQKKVIHHQRALGEVQSSCCQKEMRNKILCTVDYRKFNSGTKMGVYLLPRIIEKISGEYWSWSLANANFYWDKSSIWDMQFLSTWVKAVQNFPIPIVVKSMRSFLGLASYYRRFIPGFSWICDGNRCFRRGVRCSINTRKWRWSTLFCGLCQQNSTATWTELWS